MGEREPGNDGMEAPAVLCDLPKIFGYGFCVSRKPLLGTSGSSPWRQAFITSPRSTAGRTIHGSSFVAFYPFGRGTVPSPALSHERETVGGRKGEKEGR